MAAYIKSASRLSQYLRDPRAAYYYINKATRPPFARDHIFKLTRNFLPKCEIEPLADLKTLQTDGVVQWENFIDDAQMQRIRAYLADKKVYNARDTTLAPLDMNAIDLNRNIKLKYFYEDMAKCEDIVQIGNHPHVLALISNYFGCKPTLSIMEVWWTKTGPQDAQSAGGLYQDDMYHRDVEDFKFAKLFVYLSDVGPKNGAHAYIKGSHDSDKLTRRGPITDAEADSAFPADKRVLMTGKAGTAFVEDTWGLHRATPATEGERLLLSYTYSLTSFNPQSPKEPLAVNTYGVDPYINRVFLRSKD